MRKDLNENESIKKKANNEKRFYSIISVASTAFFLLNLTMSNVTKAETLSMMLPINKSLVQSVPGNFQRIIFPSGEFSGRCSYLKVKGSRSKSPVVSVIMDEKFNSTVFLEDGSIERRTLDGDCNLQSYSTHKKIARWDSSFVRIKKANYLKTEGRNIVLLLLTEGKKIKDSTLKAKLNKKMNLDGATLWAMPNFQYEGDKREETEDKPLYQSSIFVVTINKNNKKVSIEKVYDFDPAMAFDSMSIFKNRAFILNGNKISVFSGIGGPLNYLYDIIAPGKPGNKKKEKTRDFVDMMLNEEGNELKFSEGGIVTTINLKQSI